MSLAMQESLNGLSFNLLLVAEQGKPAEEKFNKIKQMYTKLRTEHVQLLRTVSFVNFLGQWSLFFFAPLYRSDYPWLVSFLEWRCKESIGNCREREKGWSQSLSACGVRQIWISLLKHGDQTLSSSLMKKISSGSRRNAGISSRGSWRNGQYTGKFKQLETSIFFNPHEQSGVGQCFDVVSLKIFQSEKLLEAYQTAEATKEALKVMSGNLLRLSSVSCWSI